MKTAVANDWVIDGSEPPFASEGPRVIAFIETYLVHTVGRWAGRPFKLEPWQRAFIYELFRLDDNGMRVYQSVLLGIPRKNGKTALAAAIALYLLVADEENSPEVILAAGKREQAGLVYNQARAFVEANPALQDFLEAQKYAITCDANSGSLRTVSADGKLQHGLNISGLIKDEFHAWTTPKQIALNEALETASGARDEPLSVTITTAGHDMETLLGQLYKRSMDLPEKKVFGGLNVARDEANGFLFWWFGAPEGAAIDDENVWASANPASWITPKFLRRQLQRTDLDENSFRTLHLNQWTKARSAWLPTGCWSGMAHPEIDIPDGATVYVGIDASRSSDCTAVTWAYPFEEEDGTIRVIVRCRIWAAKEGAAAHDFSMVSRGTIDLRVVRDYIRDVIGERYAIQEIVYDPRFFDTIAQDLDDDGFIVAPLETSSKLMKDAENAFYQGCRNGLLIHDGNDQLASHVEATAAVMQDNGWKIRRMQATSHIDACISTVIAYWRASREFGEESSYIFDITDEDMAGDFEAWANAGE